jgi:hypothetical protein
MASIQKRGTSISVVYTVDGKQRWESFKNEKEAGKRKREIEYEMERGTFTPPSVLLVEDFLSEEYIRVCSAAN